MDSGNKDVPKSFHLCTRQQTVSEVDGRACSTMYAIFLTLGGLLKVGLVNNSIALVIEIIERSQLTDSR